MQDYIVPTCYVDVVESLNLYIKYDLPVLLTGPVGCGKSALLRYIAALSGRQKPPQLVTVQLCKDLDGRALLGAYHCTDVGGEFKWLPGPLTSAVLNSSWVILEDLDNAAVDALSILLPLIQSRSLQVPELGKTVQAGPDFRLFATLRTHESRSVQNHRVDMVLLSHFKRLHLDKIPTSDINLIAGVFFPKLSLILPRLLQVLDLTCQPDLCDDPQVRRVLSSRLISLRDFFKICRRLSSYMSSSSMDQIESIFLDIYTCFCAFIADTAVKGRLARLLGSILGLANSDVDYYISKRKPEIVKRESSTKIGRLTLTKETLIRTDDLVVRPVEAMSLHPSVLRLVEGLASCISSNEAALLVGETGTGKTTIIQYLADCLGRKLHVINLSHQAETSDLFGGYKPVEFRSQMYPLMEAFLSLFASTFSARGNEAFLAKCHTAFGEKNWATLLAGMQHIADSAKKRFDKAATTDDPIQQEQARNWRKFGLDVEKLRLHQRSLVFAFLEGTLVKSFRLGDWVLLDEINLASPELLAGLHCFIDSTSQTFMLSDRGDTEGIERHPDFRLFACMNPATDVGKRELPADIRSRFTEIYCEELTDLQEIQQVVLSYLEPLGVRVEDETSSPSLTETVANLHVELKALAEKSLVDGVSHKPHYSLRTFTQALRYAARNPMGNVRRSLYEGFSLSYLTQLNRQSQTLVKATISSRLLPAVNSVPPKFLPPPRPAGNPVQIEGYYVERGRLAPVVDEKYIMTDTVKSNLAEIARAVSAGRIPVLLQGETSIGKTSLITWLANATGNKCVRINNHEFTDLQDYIGSYQTNAAGKLVFVEGVLVNAVRKGFWIILDELNLAPSDVLEALNRLLDSNRELFIPEKQEVIKAHPQFMLFATQNPPGYYGGRKTLSRAFRNRFIEMHFDEIPPAELQLILEKRCALPRQYAKKIVDVMLELQARRKMSGIFAGKQGFMTLRDLFRWGERYRLTPTDGSFHNWSQHLADHGFLLLGGRVRKPEELNDIKLTLEKHFNTTIDSAALYGSVGRPSVTTESTLNSFMGCGDSAFSHIVWTSNLRRMVALAGTALSFGEPVLLVGETGCGKTTVSQIYASLKSSKLFAVGCHMNTETSDFLGGLRPARPEDKNAAGLFLWKDGPLVEAMQQGGVMLLDEISLAADSVLERINSVLEPERQLVLTEKNSADAEVVPLVTAVSEFRLVATMNPGGDFGKKELSPALRNRFTEIWCDNLDILQDLKPLLGHNLFRGTPFWDDGALKLRFETAMVEFVNWFLKQCPRVSITGRDVMSWISFINRYLTEGQEAIVFSAVQQPLLAYFHGTCMVFENMASGFLTATFGIENFLQQQLSSPAFSAQVSLHSSLLSLNLTSDAECFGVQPFLMARRSGAVDDATYDFASVSVRRSLRRMLRGLMVAKGILLEGPPGVGKTSIVKALAAATGHKVVRINLSEQTDISELFGSDMPLEESDGRSLFAWRDGPFLDALKRGSWILLDELNLASQSVLEGLNACLDHRGEIFIPELNRSFKVDTKTTRIFACQNPVFQGSGRKGLPKSFLSRFTQVFVEELQDSDLLSICKRVYPSLATSTISSLLSFNQAVQNLIAQHRIGSDGQPWEFNLRDVMRWCSLLESDVHTYDPDNSNEAVFVDLLYVSRFRCGEDRRIVSQLAVDMGVVPAEAKLPRVFLKTELTKDRFVVGRAGLPRSFRAERPELVEKFGEKQLLRSQSEILEKLAVAVSSAFPVILVGPQGTAKSSVLEFLSAVTGNHLEIVSMNSDTDASDLLGGFEQNNWQRDVGNAARHLTELADYVSSDAGVCSFFREAAAEISLVLSATEQQSTSARALAKLKQVLAEIARLEFSEVSLHEKITRTTSACQRAAFSLESTRKGRFEWCDSVVVKALLEGSWLLIDNANLCSPAVLDRLNSVLEPNGELFVPERGNGDAALLRAHPNFRLFMTTNPKYGELSRAMRNRGIEIFIPTVLHDHDCLALLTRLGLPDHVAMTLLEFLQKVSPSKALSVEDICSIGREVWMRLAEKATLQVALQKAVLHSTSFPEDCTAHIANLGHFGSHLPVCPYPVTIRGLLQDRVGTNVSRHKSSMDMVSHRLPDLLNLVTAAYGLLKYSSQWAALLDMLNKSVFLSLFSPDDWQARLSIVGTSANQQLSAGRFLSQIDRFVLALGGRDFRLSGSWLRSSFSWNVPAALHNADLSFETERVVDFFELFVVWIMEVITDPHSALLSYGRETAGKLAIAAIWFHSLQIILMRNGCTSHGAVSVVWRLFSVNVLTSLHLLDCLPDRIATVSRHFDDDFYVSEDVTRVLIRKSLVHVGPFSSTEEFRVYNELLLATGGDVLADLPADDVLALLRDKVQPIVAVFDATTPAATSSEDWRFWKLIQIEFLQCALQQHSLYLVASVIRHWGAFPVVLQELFLMIQKPKQVLSPLDGFACKFILLTKSSDPEFNSGKEKDVKLSHEIMATFPEYLWWREILHLLPSKSPMGGATLANFQAQVALSKRAQRHLWRNINSQSSLRSILELDLNSIARYLKSCLETVLPGATLPINEQTSCCYWELVFQALPVVDVKSDQLAQKIFTAIIAAVDDVKLASPDSLCDFAWISSGLVTMKALFPLFVDPVDEQQITRNSLLYQAVECEASLRVTTDYFTNIYGSGDPENFDPDLVASYQQQLDYAKSSLNHPEMKAVWFRPEPSMYHALIQDARGLRDIVLRRTLDLLKASDEELEPGTDSVAEFSSALASLKAVAGDLRRKYFAYQDMISPFLSGIYQVLYGLDGALRTYQRAVFLTKTPGSSTSADLLGVLSRIFGIHGKECLNYYQAARAVWKQRNAVVRLYKSKPEDRLLLEIRLILLVLQILRFHAFHCRQHAPSVALRNAVFLRFAVIWHDIEQVKKKAEEEKAQLYKFAVDENQRSQDTAFPSYQQDLDNLSAEMQALEMPSKQTAGHQKFFEQVQTKIVHLHRELVSIDQVSSPAAASEQDAIAEIVSLALDVGCELMSSFPELCDFGIDATGFLLQSHFYRRSIEQGINVDRDSANFYYDSNVQEAKQCVPLVRDVKLRVAELLEEWPSHPVLNEVSVIIDRLLSFQLSEPLAKLLMALELILDKCQHWEAKAHCGVSLQVQMESLASLVAQWRRLELSQWQNALDQVARQKAEKATKWWLLLFATVMETVADDAKPDTVVGLVKVVQKFVESSSLGEYRIRLDLLRTVSLHFVTSRGSSDNPKLKKVCTVLRNLHAFYNQFVPMVESSIADQRKPIEKALKNFVSTQRWKDMNYIALKPVIQKAHRIIHKHMRELEAVLDQPVVLKRPVADVLPVLASATTCVTLGVLPQLPEDSLLPNLANVLGYLRKSRRVARQIITSFDYRAKLDELNETSVEFWERLKSFKEPALDLPTAKRKEATKNMIRGKNLAFSDLVKSLGIIGLSHRKGSVAITPLSGIATFDAQFSPILSDQLSRLSTNCQELYWSNVSGLAVFRRLSESPNKDLNIPSRALAIMKGFTEHLHQLILDQVQAVYAAGQFGDNLQEHLDSTLAASLSSPRVNGTTLRTFIVRGLDIHRDALVMLDKHLLLLDATPRRDDEQSQRTEDILSVVYGEPEALFQGDARWTALRSAITAYRDTICAKLGTVKSNDGPLHVVGKAELREAEAMLEFFETSQVSLANIAELSAPVSRPSITGLLDRMDVFMRDWSLSCSTDLPMSAKLPATAKRVVVQCLKAFQTTTAYCQVAAEKSVELTTGCPVVSLTDGSLRGVLEALNTAKVFRSIQVLVRQFNAFAYTAGDSQSVLISRSFLETYMVVVRHMQAFGFRLLESCNLLLRVLLNIFTDIIENGFGKVEDIEEGTNQENGHEAFEESEQAGLGEGEGAKDVSDQIESEDQLEDTKTPGKEKEEKSSDEKIADEEHGIEMTDDFEGVMDDVPTEEQGSDDEDDTEAPEVDDQMGSLDGEENETEENLDKKFWDGEDEDASDPEDDQADQENKETSDAQGVDEKEKIDLAPKNSNVADSPAKNDEQQPMEEGDEAPETEEMGVDADEMPSADGPDLDLPDKMDVDNDEDVGDDGETPSEDALTEEAQSNDESNLPETAEEDNAQSTEALEQENESDIPELSQDEALKAPSTVPPTDRNDSDMGTDGAGMPAELDNDQNPDNDDQNNDDAVNSDAVGRSTAASGRKANDESGHDVDARLPQGEPPPRKKPSTVEKRSLEAAAEKKKTAGNRNESYRKRLKISQADNQRTVEKEQKSQQNQADMYEHVPDEANAFDEQVVDAASKEESKEQKPDRSQMDEDMEANEEDMVVDDLEEEEKLPDEDTPENPAILLKSKKDQVNQKKEAPKNKLQPQGQLNIPGEAVLTLGALPESRTFYGSQLALLESLVPQNVDVDALRKELVQDMAVWSGRHFDSLDHERLAMDLWRKYEAITQSLSHELCEQLRLVLEPTKKSKLKGDYRTGKRLNMRKVVAYVASDFRKDKIWQRRTLPSQRQYQVLIAVDDSSSMADNQTKELAFESLAVLSNALTVLEVGELAICSFGQGVELLHPFQVPFSSSDGARVLTKFSFAQKKTNIAEMVELVTGVFDESRSRLLNVTSVSQLLLIVSDGRGIFREGVEVVKQSVRRLVSQSVFTVFVILDNPSETHSQGSILDIRVPVFGGNGQGLELRNYMQDFPFPFYLVLRNVKELPSTLCDALRQWFEMVSQHV